MACAKPPCGNKSWEDNYADLLGLVSQPALLVEPLVHVPEHLPDVARQAQHLRVRTSPPLKAMHSILSDNGQAGLSLAADICEWHKNTPAFWDHMSSLVNAVQSIRVWAIPCIAGAPNGPNMSGTKRCGYERNILCKGRVDIGSVLDKG